MASVYLKRCSGEKPQENKYCEFKINGRAEMTIGRDMDCEVRINSIEISRRHAKLVKDKGSHHWAILDLNSTNGIFVNGKVIMPSTPHSLKEGDTVSFGPTDKAEFVYQFLTLKTEAREALANEDASDPSGASQLAVVSSSSINSGGQGRAAFSQSSCGQQKSKGNGSVRHSSNSKKWKTKGFVSSSLEEMRSPSVLVNSVQQPEEILCSPNSVLSRKSNRKLASKNNKKKEKEKEEEKQVGKQRNVDKEEKKATERLNQLENEMKEKSKNEEKLRKRIRSQEMEKLKRELEVKRLQQELDEQRRKAEEAEETLKEKEEMRIKEEEDRKRILEEEAREKNALQELLKKKNEQIESHKKCLERKRRIPEESASQPVPAKKLCTSGDRQEAELEVASTSANSIRQKYADIFDSELTCSICHELFIHPINVSCAHTFCHFCIEQWKRNKLSRRECPICRKPITSQTRQLVVENLIDKIVTEMDAETQEVRKRAVDERDKILPFTASTSQHSSVFQPIQENSWSTSGSDSDDFEWSDDSASDTSGPIVMQPQVFTFHSTINIDDSDEGDEDADEEDDEDEDVDIGEYHYEEETGDGFDHFVDNVYEEGPHMTRNEDEEDEDEDESGLSVVDGLNDGDSDGIERSGSDSESRSADEEGMSGDSDSDLRMHPFHNIHSFLGLSGYLNDMEGDSLSDSSDSVLSTSSDSSSETRSGIYLDESGNEVRSDSESQYFST